jgi:hypothetical protein
VDLSVSTEQEKMTATAQFGEQLLELQPDSAAL